MSATTNISPNKPPGYKINSQLRLVDIFLWSTSMQTYFSVAVYQIYFPPMTVGGEWIWWDNNVDAPVNDEELLAMLAPAKVCKVIVYSV